MIISATGHRPHKLGGYTPTVRYALGGLAVEHLHFIRPAEVIVGMALGWDQAVCAAAIALKIPVHAAVPFDGQESRWRPEDQARYKDLLKQCATVTVISKWQGDDAYRERNRWMVDRSQSVSALWDGTMGGTHHCIRYAEKRGVPVTNLWDHWTLDQRRREALVGL